MGTASTFAICREAVTPLLEKLGYKSEEERTQVMDLIDQHSGTWMGLSHLVKRRSPEFFKKYVFTAQWLQRLLLLFRERLKELGIRKDGPLQWLDQKRNKI